MKFFRFCRQGLTALPVFLVFISCDKLLPTSGNGELAPVKIRLPPVAIFPKRNIYKVVTE